MGRATVNFTPEILLEFCKSGKKTLIVKSDIPDDARLVGVEYSATRDIWLLGFESDSLPDTPRSQPLPMLDPPEFTVINET